MDLKSLKDINFKNKKVIIRVDYNVPLALIDNEYTITDDKRIEESIPTLEYILKQKPSEIIILSHLGRPKLVTDKKRFSLFPVFSKLEKYLENHDCDLTFIQDPSPNQISQHLSKHKKSKQTLVALVENTRFLDINDNLESTLNKKLAQEWANLGDVFVFDGWGVAHRDSTSGAGIPLFMKESCLGFLVEKELLTLEIITKHPKRPLTVIIGGAKVSDKIKVIKNILNFADHLIIAGGLAFSFYKALGHEIGTSLVENDYLATLKTLLEKHSGKIILPIDNVLSTEFKDQPGVIRNINQFKANEMGMDIGPYSIKAFSDIILKSKSIIWNGPVGVFEMDHFKEGTKSLLELLANNPQIYSFIGGGDTAAACAKFGLEKKVSFISTGGGVCLTFLEGKELKGISNIQKR
ncbi:phosphoglycerate kinase [Mycoplasma sp. SG1]|uniref:phosphoglycerate kinase n=1 Tax=Mycoplasma sp. SG1 TaxID=2810348 RepID=UPI00202595C7|nr:phosphoglycerate kinase [Mycoplasma sp. SG1]URM52952.1 phosphoglycerate kinase [Mycoplasma sp. SG1]